MPQFPIRNGTFTLPPSSKLARVSSITITAGTLQSSVTITDSDGNVIYACSLPSTCQATLSGTDLQALPPGDYTVAVVGNPTGSLTTE